MRILASLKDNYRDYLRTEVYPLNLKLQTPEYYCTRFQEYEGPLLVSFFPMMTRLPNHAFLPSTLKL